MPYRFSHLDELGDWHGRIVRASRLVAKPDMGRALLDAVGEAAYRTPETERVLVGYHHAPDGRMVVLLQTFWDDPATLRRANNPDTPLHFKEYAELVETWSMEYFEEYLDWSPRPHADPRLGRLPRGEDDQTGVAATIPETEGAGEPGGG